MPIPLACTCGRNFRLKDELAGRKVRCPDCSAVMDVPNLSPYEEVVDYSQEEPPVGVPGRTPYGSEAHEPAYERPAVAPRPPAPSKPRKKRRSEQRRDAPSVTFEQGWFGSLNAGVIGGLLMILIAVAWFVGGLMVGIIFFYPPVLLVVGLIAFGRGLVTRE